MIAVVPLCDLPPLCLPPRLQYDGTFEDYLEMFIQFGYVILFSSAFPLAALCALLNNVIEIRSDAFKLCAIFQRPFGQRARNIGTWQVWRARGEGASDRHRAVTAGRR